MCLKKKTMFGDLPPETWVPEIWTPGTWTPETCTPEI